jgi:tryptophanyl-tRNA synthetase
VTSNHLNLNSVYIQHLIKNDLLEFYNFNIIDNQIEEGGRLFLYSGRGPSSNSHFGHIPGWLILKDLQKLNNCHILYEVADEEKYFTKNLTALELSIFSKRLLQDLNSIGFQVDKTHIFKSSENIGPLYNITKPLYRFSLKYYKVLLGFKDDNNIGSIFYSPIQSGICLIPSLILKSYCILIITSKDQLPHFRSIQKYISSNNLPIRIGFIIIKELKDLQTNNKMSSSIPKYCLFLRDPPKIISQKILQSISGGRNNLEEFKRLGLDKSKDFCYNLLTFLNLEIPKPYIIGKMLSLNFKKLVIKKIIKFLNEYKKVTNLKFKILNQNFLNQILID